MEEGTGTIGGHRDDMHVRTTRLIHHMPGKRVRGVVECTSPVALGSTDSMSPCTDSPS